MRICITSWHAGPLIDPGDPRPVGGAETRAWTFARGLARLPDVEVHLAVRGRGRILRRSAEGVHVWNLGDGLDADRWLLHDCVSRTGRFPGVALRRLDFRLLKSLSVLAATRLFQGPARAEQCAKAAYAKIPADIHVAFGLSASSHLVMQAARGAGVPFVVAIAHNLELDARLLSGESFQTPYQESAEICRQVLLDADGIVVQTDQQRQWLRDRINRDGTHINNPIDLDDWDRLAETNLDDANGRSQHDNRHVLWVGRADSFHKRPELAYELARRMSDIPFVMVLNPGEAELERKLRRECPANVTLIRKIPFAEMPGRFRRGAVFLNTSAEEGFPNTFLQAAASRVPIASLDVEAEWLARSGAGFCAAGNSEHLAQWIRSVVNDVELADSLGRAGRQFVETEHSADRQSERLKAALLTVLKQ